MDDFKLDVISRWHDYWNTGGLGHTEYYVKSTDSFWKWEVGPFRTESNAVNWINKINNYKLVANIVKKPRDPRNDL